MLKDPKLALAIAIYQGAIALMVDHGEGAMDANTAVQRSRQAMWDVLGEPVSTDLKAIEAEFVNARYYQGEHRWHGGAR